MIYNLSEVAYVGFTTNDATGAAADADSTPTASLIRNGSADGAVTVTVTNLSTGAYIASFTVPSGYAVADDLQLLISATVDAIAGKAFVGQGKVDSTVNSVYTRLGAPANGSIAADIAAVSDVPPYAVTSIKTTLSGTENDYLRFFPGDEDDVVIFFTDTSNTPVTIPAITSVALIDATGATVGTATLGTEHLASGYVPISVEIPSSGNMPVRLRIVMSGPITKNIPVKVVS